MGWGAGDCYRGPLRPRGEGLPTHDTASRHGGRPRLPVGGGGGGGGGGGEGDTEVHSTAGEDG